LKSKISQNYFTGESDIPLELTLEQAEVLFSASDSVKNLASSGALKTLHERCTELKESSESSFLNTKDRILNIVEATHSKENEIYDSLIEDYEIDGIRKHESGQSIFDVISLNQGFSTTENLSILEGAIDKETDPNALVKI
jgi:hypothetical protein